MRVAPTLFGLFIIAASGCEASLMGDYASRTGARNAPASVGGSSPRWAADHPQPPAQPSVTQGNTNVAATATPATLPGTTTNENASAAPWTNGANPISNTPTPVAVGPIVQPNFTTTTRAMDPPGEACSGACRGGWQRCFDGCNNGQDRGCVAQCDEPYRDCMRGCY